MVPFYDRLTKRLHQQLQTQRVRRHLHADGGVHAHIGQHPDQLDQDVVVLPAGHPYRRGVLALPQVAAVEPQQGGGEAAAAVEARSRRVAAGRQVPQGEEQADHQVLRGEHQEEVRGRTLCQ